ncbi:MAG: undecaprenyl/decaprenyl-phosphate alpha-N-acetylglucosaminyl 1-phosphate transferase [Candidatus Eisenbacteria bacterium]|nr:undecaprenyl/decaprenyl-phosphate alpha-N-acetylglucosaminyl 1-phosphate transferase [Candidatus Eisenbacteria bacterium]
MSYVFSFAAALLAVALLVPIVRRLALRSGFLDQPSARKVHTKPTPLLGGLAVLIGFLAAFLSGARLEEADFSSSVVGFLLGGIWVFLVGLADDRFGTGPLVKLPGQIIGCAILFFSGNTNGLITSAPLDLLFSFLWVVGMMNAVNFLDNMDGLAAGITFLAASGFFAISLLHGQTVPALIAISLAGAALAFLRFNFHPASIFLGDAGSLFFGYALAALGIMSTWHMTSHSFLLVPVLILGYPIFDIGFVVLTRIARGRRIYLPGKDHSSHRLWTLLANVRGTAAVVYGVCFVLALLGVALSFTSDRSFYWTALLLVATVSLWSGRRLARVPVE